VQLCDAHELLLLVILVRGVGRARKADEEVVYQESMTTLSLNTRDVNVITREFDVVPVRYITRGPLQFSGCQMSLSSECRTSVWWVWVQFHFASPRTEANNHLSAKRYNILIVMCSVYTYNREYVFRHVNMTRSIFRNATPYNLVEAYWRSVL
jgi:hypothetical protein